MSLMIFDFENQPVRAFERDGQDWFVAVDVCRCLGIVNNRDAVTRLPDDEKSEVDLRVVASTDGIRPGNPNATVISEPAVYRLIFESRKPEAERLKRFVFHEVLPALRRTGAYAPEPDWELMRDKMAMIRETRLTHGRAAAQAMWRELGMPLPPDETSGPQGRETDMQRELYGYIADFLEQCCEEAAEARVRTSELHKVYNRWAAAAGAPYATLTAFGLAMRFSPYRRVKTSTTFYSGLRIREDVRRRIGREGE